ncbi:MAG: peroxide stress protein YaaA [Bacteroidetes bacterium]|nr:MAG: peroxide stress protein YaaA [Bacteroidota bacterium]MBL1145194.1 peroxide stress protein YaaA [Bacteroidota bacterium]NOG57990.1 peroxide stress protein YaaA [Bacteroidota bacterium]
MIHLLSPAKSLDYNSAISSSTVTIPENLSQAEKLIKKLKKTSSKDLKSMMSISDALVKLNKTRFDTWQGKLEISDTSRQAIFAFSGDVYVGLDAYSLNQKDLEFAQNNLRILSGLYGILRPYDIIEPYRLEMGSSLKVGRKKNLYEFWGTEIASNLKSLLATHQEKTLVNLASNEYFKVVDKKTFDLKIISPQFKDSKNGEYKIIAFFAKKARGLMSRYIIENKIESSADLLGFDYEGYRYNEKLSKENEPVFTREENQIK